VLEKREALIKWTILLAILTFALSLIGTFLVRSGILSSVHAFATDPERGVFILLLLGIAIGGSLALYAWRAPSLADGGMFASISRESGLLLNNLLLSTACAVVFVGTLYPLFLELITGEKITVGAPYFNATFLPLFAAAMIFAGIGPFLAWKRARLKDVIVNAGWCLAATLAIIAVMAAVLGLRDPVGLFGGGVAAFLATATLFDLGRRLGLPKSGARSALRRLAGLPRSAWGLYLGHLGMAVVAAGVVAISVWRVEAIQLERPGEPVEVGPFEFSLLDVAQAQGPNYQTSVATVRVTRGGELVTILFPERRWYPVEQQPTTEAGIQTRWHGDLYAVLGDPNGTGAFVTRYYYNPGVPWMWLGAVMIAAAGLISLTDRRLRVGAPARMPSPVMQAAE
jgi:cytochrome c-type biogenesis protein CcmF